MLIKKPHILVIATSDWLMWPAQPIRMLEEFIPSNVVN